MFAGLGLWARSASARQLGAIWKINRFVARPSFGSSGASGGVTLGPLWDGSGKRTRHDWRAGLALQDGRVCEEVQREPSAATTFAALTCCQSDIEPAGGGVGVCKTKTAGEGGGDEVNCINRVGPAPETHHPSRGRHRSSVCLQPCRHLALLPPISCSRCDHTPAWTHSACVKAPLAPLRY